MTFPLYILDQVMTFLYILGRMMTFPFVHFGSGDDLPLVHFGSDGDDLPFVHFRSGEAARESGNGEGHRQEAAKYGRQVLPFSQTHTSGKTFSQTILQPLTTRGNECRCCC